MRLCALSYCDLLYQSLVDILGRPGLFCGANRGVDLGESRGREDGTGKRGRGETAIRM